MAKNANLNKAKETKLDEFYTERVDIENELSHYTEHFRDKIVYCNCDDPVDSEFWKFFVRNFKAFGLKKLMATHYEPDEKNYAYMLEICEDTNGDGRIDWRDEPTITQIPCNGDFRSAYCIELLKQADIVVTNPPFSLIREYILQLMEYNKKFLIIGPLNAVKYKDTFPLLREGRMWVGYTHPKRFRVPDTTTGNSIFEENGVKYQKFGNVQWYTNLDIPKRHEKLDLRGNYYKSDDFPKYYNYPAIDVDKVINIPCDYEGEMGVPISFLETFNSEQFELIGIGRDGMGITVDRSVYEETKKTNKNGRPSHLGYFKPDGKAFEPYDRVIIKLKNPEPRRYIDED